MSSCKCQKCFSDFIIGAPSAVRVNALLTPETDYVWELTDGFGNIYHQDFTTESDGIGYLDMSQMPPGFANAAQAPLSIRVKESASDCEYVPLVVAQRYAQISMDFRAGTAIKDWVACPIGAPGPTESIQITTEEGDTIITEEGDTLIT